MAMETGTEKVRSILLTLTEEEKKEMFEILKDHFSKGNCELSHQSKFEVVSACVNRVPSPTISCYTTERKKRINSVSDNIATSFPKCSAAAPSKTIQPITESEEADGVIADQNSMDFDVLFSSEGINDIFASDSLSESGDTRSTQHRNEKLDSRSNMDLGSYSEIKSIRTRRYSSCDAGEFYQDTMDYYYGSEDNHSGYSPSLTSRSTRPDSPRLNSLREYSVHMFSNHMTQSEISSDSLEELEISEIKEVSDIEGSYNLL